MYPGSLVCATMFMMCGIIQTGTGIMCWIVIPNVFHSTSSIWIGITNFVLGITIVSGCVSKKMKLTLCIFILVAVINLSNLLIMELSEWWKLITGKQLAIYMKGGRTSLLVAGYLSIVVPSTIGFVVGFLAAQLICCNAMSERKNQPMTDGFDATAMSSMSPHQERPTFQWVFQETESSQKLHNNKLNTLWQNNGTKCPSAHQYESVENHSEGETENETSATCYDLALPSRIANNYAEKTEMASSSIPTSTNKNTTTSTSSIFLTEEPHSNCNIFRWKLDSVSPSRCKPRIALWENSTAILSLAQQDQTRCLSSAAFSLPMDSDSLINLSYLELLARQWRFYCQHKELKRQVSLRLTQKASL